jgi:hypothetical protein
MFLLLSRFLFYSILLVHLLQDDIVESRTNQGEIKL